MRKKLTDEWEERRVQEGVENAILTDEMTKAWSGLSVREYKDLKGLKKENLRDNMTDIELVLNMLAEVTTTALKVRTAKYNIFGIGYFVKSFATHLCKPYFERLCLRRRNRLDKSQNALCISSKGFLSSY